MDGAYHFDRSWDYSKRIALHFNADDVVRMKLQHMQSRTSCFTKDETLGLEWCKYTSSLIDTPGVKLSNVVNQ